ncbi:hypothetical protein CHINAEXTREME_11950 [Halobiforma lacisalsi AJ5]|uniref:Uncharacterized protein n=1 Tax=Natronobacterium lacisalsi AJ5 TaxID=358396 RepID=M0LMN8_NATLA|nr:hypothetical protein CHINAEXTREME_11950 [Halobiforma lacisalsi AJ5]EMA33295.1 hypothetical protein C445_09239 [Halobiforma lacisalsi AJ5]
MDVRQVVPNDAIPSVDEPTFGTDYYEGLDEDVIVIESTLSKTYPMSILDNHESSTMSSRMPVAKRQARATSPRRSITATTCTLTIPRATGSASGHIVERS